ncbi:hypothetical protein [Diaphorobacter aerolatus]|uniref:hypothetical protein n=1 Tax=Diaphorobacter aerolatus TaxID=1288495 RepID=UPI001D021412|nr:hypothetical protein [Diaphorobacter aerolatus]
MSLHQRFLPLAVVLPAPQAFIRIVPKAVFFTVKQRAIPFAFIHAPPSPRPMSQSLNAH